MTRRKVALGREQIPALFIPAWEQRKVSDLFDIVDDRGYPELPVLSATQDLGMVPRDGSGRFVGHDKANEQGYKKVSPGDFVIHLRSFQGGFAHSPITGITSPAYTVFAAQKPDEHSDRFWKHWFMSRKFIDSLATVTYGIRDGRNISVEEFFDTKLLFPAKAEQDAIASTLNQLDNLITLHQREHFQQTEPKHIAVGVSAWEQRKLGDIAVEVTRVTPTTSAPVMMISTPANGFIYQSEHYAFDNTGESLKKYIHLKKGELAYSHGASKLRPYGSCFALKNDEARVPFVYHAFAVGENDSEFVSTQLNLDSMQQKLMKLISSGARMDGLLNISYEEYMTLDLMMPSYEEQKRISGFLIELDSLITLHQRELNYEGS